MPSRGDFTYLKDRTASLLSIADKLKPETDDPSYAPYSVLKIMALRSIAWAFLKAAKGPRSIKYGYDAAVYIDLFAGSGVTRIKGKFDPQLAYVGGSSFAATYDHRDGMKFDLSFLIETKKKRAELLRKRSEMLGLKDDVIVIEGNCNDKITEVVDVIESQYRKPIIFVFSDPEGMDAVWDVYDTLSSSFNSIDYLINVSSGIERVYGTLRRGHKSFMRPVMKSLGMNEEQIMTEIHLDEQFPDRKNRFKQRLTDQFREYLGKTIASSIPIYSRTGWGPYSLEYYTRRTITGSDWTKSVNYTAEKLKKLDGNQVVKALNQLKGKIKPLDV